MKMLYKYVFFCYVFINVIRQDSNIKSKQPSPSTTPTAFTITPTQIDKIAQTTSKSNNMTTPIPILLNNMATQLPI